MRIQLENLGFGVKPGMTCSGKVFLTPAAESHGLCPWMNASRCFSGDVAPLGRQEGCHGLCPWGSTRPASPGFTLLELIVTTTLLSLILVMVLGALRLGSASWERGGERAEKYQRRRVVLDLLSQQMKSSYPYKVKAQRAEADYLVYVGEPETLKFVSSFSIKSRKPEGFVYVIYRVVDGGPSHKNLALFEKRILRTDFMEETPGDEEFVTLVDDLSDLTFEYFQEAEEEDEPGEWLTSWEGKDKKILPRQVRLTATWKDEKRGGDEEVILPTLIPIPAYRFEDRKATRTPFQRPMPMGRR